MVEVFRTDVAEQSQGERLVSALMERFPDFKVNFDLEDCDRILRIEAKSLNPLQVIECLRSNGHLCELLD